MVQDLGGHGVLAALQHGQLLDVVVVDNLELDDADLLPAVLEARLAASDDVVAVLYQLYLIVRPDCYGNLPFI